MDFYIASVLTQLGISKQISVNFPNEEQELFIRTVMTGKNTNSESQAESEEWLEFERTGLQGLVTAKEFFRKLRQISGRGSYKSSSIRMDVQIATRACAEAPDCKFNMVMRTRDWNETLNIELSTAEQLLQELRKVKTFIRKNREIPHTPIE